MPIHKKHKPSCKIWIEHEGKPVLGRGGAKILECISREKSISKAAKKLGMSYRYTWNHLQRMGKAIGQPVVETFRGGKSGGGGARLTHFGKNLLDEYKRVEGYLGEVIADEEYWEAVGLKISARNRFKGEVVAIQKNGVTAKIRVEIEVPIVMTSLISREAAEELEIEVGDKVEAVVKATEVMIAK